MDNNNSSYSLMKKCAFVMAFFSPVAGGLLFTVTVVYFILLTKGKSTVNSREIYLLLINMLTAVLLISSGFLLLIGLIKDKRIFILLYLIFSCPSLCFITYETVASDFIYRLKVRALIFLSFMFCGQTCVCLVYYKIHRKRKANRHSEHILLVSDDDYSGYFNCMAAEESSFDNTDV